MESVKLLYCVKLCDEVDCFNNHLTSIYKIEDHIKGCFKAHIIRDKLFNYVFKHNATVSEATHMTMTMTMTNIYLRIQATGPKIHTAYKIP